MQFFKVRSADEARRLLNPEPASLPAETVPLGAGIDRVVATDIRSPIDLPEFRRAVVDGYAVRAADTYGASAGLPAYLELVGEIPMGQPPEIDVAPGQAVWVATGGMLPVSADAVVMVEYTQKVGTAMVEIVRAAAPGEGLVEVGDDVRRGEILLPRGRRLRPQDLGAAASVGLEEVCVVRRPRVAVIPTGDEVVPPTTTPEAGQVRDVNSDALSAAVTQVGGVPVRYPIVSDDPVRLRDVLAAAMVSSDLVLIAGGSSVGTRDLTLEVLLAFPESELLLHGVSIRPGKPVIGVTVGSRLVVGLPGNPVSALIVFEQFVRPHLRRLAGEIGALPRGTRLRAHLARSFSSEPGKEDYLRVKLEQTDEGWTAVPLLGKSTLLRTLVDADGVVVVPASVEGLEAGDPVEVILF